MTNVAYLRQDAAPASVEAEQAVLGQLLLSQDLCGKVVRAGGRKLFADPLHAEIYGAIEAKDKAGHLVNPVALREFVAALPGIEGVGGPSYLARLAGAAAGASSFSAYVDMLADYQRKRELLAAMDDARSAILKGEDASDLIGSRLEASLISISDTSDGTGPVSMLKAVSVAMDQAGAAYRGESQNLVQSGISALDRMISGFYPGELILIGGRPSMGKTATALSIALNAARAGHGVCIASLEMNPEAMALRALSEATANTRDAANYSDVRRGDLTEPQMRSLVYSAQKVGQLPITFLPRQFSDIGALFAGAKQAHRATPGGLKLLVVDYAQLLRSSAPTRYEQITEISIALKALSGQLNIPVIALSQLSRQLESRVDKRPMLSDLRESGQLEQDADAVLFCYRDEYYLERERPQGSDADALIAWEAAIGAARNRLEIIVAKQRQGEIGTAKVRFNPAMNLIWEDGI